MPTVLFVCMANQFRSPLAALAFQKEIRENKIAGDWNVQSAGTWVEEETGAHPLAIQYAAQAGYDLTTHQTREVTPDILNVADIIVVMTQGQKEAIQFEFFSCKDRVFTLNELAGDEKYGIQDPAEEGFTDAQSIWQEIQSKVSIAFSKIVEVAKLNSVE